MPFTKTFQVNQSERSMKKLLVFSAIAFFTLTNSVTAQVKGFVQNFDNQDLTGWVPDHIRTFNLSIEDSALQVLYTRTAASDVWDNFNFTPPVQINVNDNPVLTVRVKSTVSTLLTFKPLYSTGDNFITKQIAGDNIWHTVSYTLVPSGNGNINKFYLYLDGGNAALKSGTVWLDDLRVGDSVNIASTLEYLALENGIDAGQKLMAASVEGSEDGTFPAGSKTILQSAITTAQQLLTNGAVNQKQIDDAVWTLYDSYVTFEKQVKAPQVPINDPNANQQTRYLYLNLLNLQTKSLLFGMHDATGYGVGWGGDNDRSDVKTVVGDYPAVFSEDVSGLERNPNNPDQAYRLSSAYNRGAVITMCWHQVDPQERGFYSADVNNENIVQTILPGGVYHELYKKRLKNVALFFKSLRGKNGENIPVIFRPYHEHSGGWFWWGAGQCSTEEYNSLWKLTVNYLRDTLNVHNVVYAISPSYGELNVNSDYTKIYPGDDYVDVIGGDYYFQSPASGNDPGNFLKFSRIIGSQIIKTGKVGALTEVGQEGLKNADWFTKYLLPSLKNDTLANTMVYAAVWRNANTTHHYAPYPGHASVPDFIDFYNDSYTMFEADLPDMYIKPVADTEAPVFSVSGPLTIETPYLNTEISVETNERSFLKWGLADLDYQNLPNSFAKGEGQFIHKTTISAEQGESKTIYVRAKDLNGNVSADPLQITVSVDTMKIPVHWYDLRYPVASWNSGPSPIGSLGTAKTVTPAQKTLYFKSAIEVASLPPNFATLLKGTGGFVMYLNSREVYRFNLPAGEITYATEPLTNTAFTKNFAMDAKGLSYFTVGTNYLSVEVHAATGSSVAAFDAQFFSQVSGLNSYYKKLGGDWYYSAGGLQPFDYTLKEIVNDVADGNSLEAKSFRLIGNYPNPFNPSTSVEFEIGKDSNVSLEVFDLLGRKLMTIMDEFRQKGVHRVNLNAGSLSSGVYLLNMKSGAFRQTKKILLAK